MRLISTVLLSLALFSGPLMAEDLKLKNGSELIVEQDLRSPRDTVMLAFLGGAGLLKPSEQGLSTLLTLILNEGPEGVSAADFKKELFLLGGELSYSAGSRQTFVSVTAPSANVAKVLELALSTLKKPKFDAENYQIALAKLTASVAQQEDNMASQLRYFAIRDAFSNHPDVLDGNTSRTSLKNLNLEKVKASLPKLFDARYLLTVATGPSSPADIQKLLNSELEKSGFLAPKLEKRVFVSAAKDVKSKGQKVVLLNKAGATDNQIRYIVRRKIPLDNPDMVALDLANKALGEGMQGSLFKVLREQRGLTYSAGSGISDNLGYIGVSSFASTDKLANLMKGIDEVVAQQSTVVIDKPTAELLKGDALTKFKESRELPGDRLVQVINARIYGRDLNFSEKEDEYIAKASEADITRLGKEFFSVKDASIYIMGDKTKLLPVLKGLGFKDVRVVEPAAVL
ncbi:MAG: insulinase family protein [Bdellovibrionota bacterium]